MAVKFSPERILSMDKEYFSAYIWPRMFYMSPSDMWRWKMNAARAMGNSLDPVYVPDLVHALKNNDDERVRCMSAWALGRIGGTEALAELKFVLDSAEGRLKSEIEYAISMGECTI
jgi:epoxyqueuosine reductase